jgi:hypothetical protein
MLSIRQQPVTSTTLRQYASVSIAFTVSTVLDIEGIEHGLGDWRLSARDGIILPVRSRSIDRREMKRPTHLETLFARGS